MSPFPRRPLPIRGESVIGFERRFASCSRYERLDAFRHVAGLRDFGPLSDASRWEDLAEIAGLKLADLRDMRLMVRDDGERTATYSMLGHEVRPVQVSYSPLSFCPHCLAEDHGPERRVLRLAWHLRLVTACPRHGNLLVDACDVCGGQFEHTRKTKAWSCGCGRQMTEINTVKAPDGAIAMSLAFMRYLGIVAATGRVLLDRRGVLTNPISSLPLGDLLSLASKIGTLVSVPASEDAPVGRTATARGFVLDPDMTIEKIALMMDRVYAIFTDWPFAADALFAEIADRNPDPEVEHPIRAMFATRVGYRLLGTLESVNGGELTVLDEALEQWLLRERGIYLDGRRRPKVAGSEGLAIDVADALRRLEGRDVNPVAIGNWLDAGAVEIVDGKVLLRTVERTVGAMRQLQSIELDDRLTIEEWCSVSHFYSYYRKADALRDILDGAIRVWRDPGREGLAALSISSDDFTRCRAKARDASRKPRVRGPTVEETRARILRERISKLRHTDGYLQPGKLNELLARIWPKLPGLDVATEPIRCKYVVRVYHGKKFGMRLYSAVDAIDLVVSRLGEPP